jgi:hypothetical protein
MIERSGSGGVSLSNGSGSGRYTNIRIRIGYVTLQVFHMKRSYFFGEGSYFSCRSRISEFFVQEPYFSMDNLQPGRNYSISVKAVSNGIESIERTVFQATRKYRRTGPVNTRMKSTGLNLYLSTRPALPIHSCTGKQDQPIQEL